MKRQRGANVLEYALLAVIVMMVVWLGVRNLGQDLRLFIDTMANAIERAAGTINFNLP